jgi:hypothetical protein
MWILQGSLNCLCIESYVELPGYVVNDVINFIKGEGKYGKRNLL